MAKTRIDVPKQTADDLLYGSRHTCCWCREPRHPVEIHHVNGDPSDNGQSNLAVLCRNCHGVVSQTGPLGRRISPGEVSRARDEWEAVCRGGGQEEPAESAHEEVLVQSGEYRDDWTYTLATGDVLVVGVDSDVAVSVMVGRESDLRRWRNGQDTDLLRTKENVFHCELEHEAKDDNRYAIWIENEQDENAIVEIDISVWSDDEDEEGDEL